MDKTNKELLDKSFERNLAYNKTKVMEEEAIKLSNDGWKYTKAQYNERLNANVEARMNKIAPKLEAQVYSDFGGSKEAANRLFQEQRQKERAKETIELKKNYDEQSKQKQADEEKAKTQQLEEQRQKLRHQFRQNAKDITKDKGSEVSM